MNPVCTQRRQKKKILARATYVDKTDSEMFPEQSVARLSFL